MRMHQFVAGGLAFAVSSCSPSVEDINIAIGTMSDVTITRVALENDSVHVAATCARVGRGGTVEVKVEATGSTTEVAARAKHALTSACMDQHVASFYDKLNGEAERQRVSAAREVRALRAAGKLPKDERKLREKYGDDVVELEKRGEPL